MIEEVGRKPSARGLPPLSTEVRETVEEEVKDENQSRGTL
jgi:hypothetical protein